MNVTLLMVSSANGKITRGSEHDVTQWTSVEDQQLFVNERRKHDVIVMGSHTYENNISRIDLNIQVPRYILTANPEAFIRNRIPDLLEFSAETPENLLKQLHTKGYTKILLVGGAEITSSFLKAGLVDELHLTIEPTLFGSGKNILADLSLCVSMKLLKISKLNTNGTLQLQYKIL